MLRPDRMIHKFLSDWIVYIVSELISSEFVAGVVFVFSPVPRCTTLFCAHNCMTSCESSFLPFVVCTRQTHIARVFVFLVKER